MAGNQELIDTIVDPVAVKQVDDLNAKIQQLEATFIAASKSALAFNSAAGGSNTNSAFVKNVNESTKATQKLIQTREQLSKTIISNSQAEVDAYNKVSKGEEGITTTVNKRNRAEAQAANEATARSAKAIAQSEKQAAEYVRAQGLIEKLTAKLKFYKQAQIEATDPRAIALYGQKIQSTEKNITQLSNAGKTGFDSLGNAVKKSSNAFQTIGAKVVTLARLLPGIGVVGLIAFATEPIIEYITQLDIFKKKAVDLINTTAVDSSDFKDALSAVNSLKTSISEFNEGTITGKELVDRYNESIGQTAGILTTTTEVENFYNSKASDYVQAMYLRARANAALEVSASKLAEAQKRAIEGPTFGDKFIAAVKRFGSSTEFDADVNVKFASNVAKAQADAVAKLNAEGKKVFELFDRLKKESDKFNKDNGFGNLDGAKREQQRLKDAADAKKRAEEAARKAKELANLLAKQQEADYKLQLDKEKTALDARTRLLDDYFENEKKLQKDQEDSVAESNNARLSNIEGYTSKELDVLVALYQAKEITEKEFNDRREVLERDAALQSIDSAIQLAEELLEIGGSTQDEEDKLAALRIKRSKLVRDNVLDDIKKEAEARKQLKDLTKNVAEEAANFVITLVNAGFENRKNKIQEEINLTDENAKAEIEAVNRSLISTSEKADKVKLIEAQADATKKQLQREQKRTDIEKAKFDKAISLARIVQATAEAEINALSYLSNPLTAPLYPGIAALIAALGAIQLATVLATPIPAYEKGTRNAKGGTSLVGERGAEYVITPQGATFLTPSTPTLMDIPKGSTVIPHLETARMMDVKNYAGGQAVDMGEVVRAIERNKPVKGKTVVNGWHREMKAASAWNNRKDQYFN